MWTKTYKIDGYKFTFNSGVSNDWPGGGVVIHPQSAEFDNPDWIAALRTAAVVYVYAEDLHDLEDYLDQLSRAPANADLEAIYRRKAAIENGPYNLKFSSEALADLKIVEDYWNGERPQAQKRKPQTDPGYVYLIQSPTNAYKIGKTIAPDNRMKTFAVKLPFEVDYVCLIQTENMSALEIELHAKFEDKRVNGEWFALSDDDVEYIKSLAVVS